MGRSLLMMIVGFGPNQISKSSNTNGIGWAMGTFVSAEWEEGRPFSFSEQIRPRKIIGRNRKRQ
jgi:hypothetical protein